MEDLSLQSSEDLSFSRPSTSGESSKCGKRAKRSDGTSRPTSAMSEHSSKSTEKMGFREIAAQALERMSHDREREQRDEYAVFGEHIASELRSMPHELCIKTKQKINRAVLEAYDEIIAMVRICVYV